MSADEGGCLKIKKKLTLCLSAGGGKSDEIIYCFECG